MASSTGLSRRKSCCSGASSTTGNQAPKRIVPPSYSRQPCNHGRHNPLPSAVNQKTTLSSRRTPTTHQWQLHPHLDCYLTIHRRRRRQYIFPGAEVRQVEGSPNPRIWRQKYSAQESYNHNINQNRLAAFCLPACETEECVTGNSRTITHTS